MKTGSPLKGQGSRSSRASLLRRGVVAVSMLMCGASARAGDTNNPITPEQMFEGGTNTYNNWIELSAGGLTTHGSAAQADQRDHLNNGFFGGIEDLHLQQDVAKKTTFTLDGRALFDEHDYKVNLALEREAVGFLKFDFENFRTWYNGAGGYYPPSGAQSRLSNDRLALDRGKISLTGGLTLKGLPQVTFKYTHSYRTGDESSTIWGLVHPDTLNNPAGVQGLYPSVYSIDEKIDSFQLDATHHIKATDFGLGLRYDMASLSNERKMSFFPGEGILAQPDVTDKEGNSYDLFSTHAFSETWLNKNLFFSAGFLFANEDSTFSGSRIYGDDFDVGYVPNSLNDLGYFNLHGGANEQQYVLNLNLMSTPLKHFTISPSIRVQQEDWDANSSGTETQGTATGPFASTSSREVTDVMERLDLRYNGITNWVFYGGGEWTEGDGNLKENGGIGQTNGIIAPLPVQFQTEDSRWFQKYFVGARWYPLRRVTIDAGGYYKNNHYDYNNTADSTPNNSLFDRYPAYLVMQSFQTYDGNLRLTLRPVQNVTLVSRYEYQYSTVNTQPDPVSGLSDVESSKLTSHIFGQNASWSPWSRLNLQAGLNYVWSQTKTPGSSMLAAQNSYWMLNFNSGIVLDDKTDLDLGYFYYQAGDYNYNPNAGVPFGAGVEEHSVTATLVRRITERLRLKLRFAYTHNNDWASGGNNNYDAFLASTSLQYRF